MEQKVYKLTVPGEFPGMNEIVAASKAHPMAYANMKDEHTEAVEWVAKAARVPTMERVEVHCHWVTKNRRRDPDNIAAAAKFVLDGLVKAKVLPSDGWRHVAGIKHTFATDRNNPRVEITLNALEAAS